MLPAKNVSLLSLIAMTIVINSVTMINGEMGEECRIRPIIHLLKHPGCVPKPIPSFACQGQCSSYVQVSGSKFWQVERSCMCCQEVGEREATTGLFCPKQVPRIRKVVTRAPVECMCRPCTGIDESAIKPQELLDIVLSGKSLDSLPNL